VKSILNKMRETKTKIYISYVDGLSYTGYIVSFDDIGIVLTETDPTNQDSISINTVENYKEIDYSWIFIPWNRIDHFRPSKL